MSPLVVISPLSGYLNRIQAIVSAKLLARDLGAQLLVHWRPSDVAPVALTDILDPAEYARIDISEQEVESLLAVAPDRVQPHLNFDSRSGVVTLAGLDLGEQAFMPTLREIVARKQIRGIFISAGGKFVLEGDRKLTPQQRVDFNRRRQYEYSNLHLHPGIEERVQSATRQRERFVGLHLRYTDRSAQAPWDFQITKALKTVRERTGITELFIASDTPDKRDEWMQRTLKLGFSPWHANAESLSRSDPRSAWTALEDWRILSKARGAVYFSASSFAEEATVAAGTWSESIPLDAGPVRLAVVKSAKLMDDARTYPRRHHWLNR